MNIKLRGGGNNELNLCRGLASRLRYIVRQLKYSQEIQNKKIKRIKLLGNSSGGLSNTDTMYHSQAYGHFIFMCRCK